MDPSSNVPWQNLENRFYNILQNYTNQLLQEPSPPTNPIPTNPPPRRTQPQEGQNNIDNEFEMLNDLIYYYSQNIREYNTNMRELIFRVEDYQTTRRSRNSTRNRYTNRYYNNTNRERENPFRMYYHAQWIPTNPASALLSREEIARSTLTYGFTEEMIIRDASGDTTNVCPISLEPLQIGDVICEIRGCAHKFKRPNLMTWLNRNSNCPVCRYNLRTPLPSEEPLTHEEHEEMEHEEEQEQDEEGQRQPHQREDVSGNNTINEARRIQDSLTQIFQNVFQGINVDSFSDGSANLLYEFEFPINNNVYNTSTIYNNFQNNRGDSINDDNDQIHDDQEVD
jgi:hypothetical protein